MRTKAGLGSGLLVFVNWHTFCCRGADQGNPFLVLSPADLDAYGVGFAIDVFLRKLQDTSRQLRYWVDEEGTCSMEKHRLVLYRLGPLHVSQGVPNSCSAAEALDVRFTVLKPGLALKVEAYGSCVVMQTAISRIYVDNDEDIALLRSLFLRKRSR